MTNPPSSGVTAPATPTSEVSTLSAYAGPYVTDMLGKAKALSETPYQVYGGPLTAGQSGLQSKVFQGLGSLNFPSNLGGSFTGNAPTEEIDPLTGKAKIDPTKGIVSQYMNPYLQSVLNPQLEELRRQSQITQMQNAGKSTAQGAFGGSRQALMDAETQRNLMQEMNKTVGTGYASAFDKAMGQFNVEQGQAKTLADLMADLGGTERKIEQEGVTADLNEFQLQRDYPQKQLQFLQSMLQNLPISTVTSQPGQQTGIGEISSIVGGLGNLKESLSKLGIKI
jgi:hypothetical protein